MKRFEDYLDAFKEKLKIESDYALAKELDVSRQQISNLRYYGGALGKEKCLRMAQALQIDPMQIIATAEAAKAKQKELKSIWLKLAKEKGNV
ncbi:hypothetical protein [Zooshikella ganghwensis]|uniref:hypothetical protein n=1 Tax=Zooshikella ganghwensis TaxID=202772 RepID=UPI0004167597|nr:hypothetical protein [Zooshikella ganghwensis]